MNSLASRALDAVGPLAVELVPGLRFGTGDVTPTGLWRAPHEGGSWRTRPREHTAPDATLPIVLFMTDPATPRSSKGTARTPRSRLLGLVIGLVVGASLVSLEWATIDTWSNVEPMLVLIGQSLVAIVLLAFFRTRWIGVGLSIVLGIGWTFVALLVWAVTQFSRTF